ncbi:hypothetical protein WUBG_16046 [Wuchereria bancrofti]|uniref:Uncharacterized protein n=1 Tax=Wuchereria bancrofti TaxID=6293 RepID=J9DTU7_WUCBA|nr:hypothetical protein WUBG_16046 [Wuchereria bancrofti]
MQSTVSDPTAALLAFSQSFKKVRRAQTVKQERSIRQQNINDISLYHNNNNDNNDNDNNDNNNKYTKIRSTSLPNPNDLYIVVRDNDKQLLKKDISIIDKMKIYQNYDQKYRFNSLIPIITTITTTTTTTSSSIISTNNYYTDNCNVDHYLQTNGSIAIIDNCKQTNDNTTKLLKINANIYY